MMVNYIEAALSNWFPQCACILCTKQQNGDEVMMIVMMIKMMMMMTKNVNCGDLRVMALVVIMSIITMVTTVTRLGLSSGQSYCQSLLTKGDLCRSGERSRKLTLLLGVLPSKVDCVFFLLCALIADCNV